MKWPSWMPRVLFESALIVFSVLLALALDEWRGERAVAARAREAVAAITAELEANRLAAESSSDFHQQVHKTLTDIAARQQLPGPDVIKRGMLRPAMLLQTAWTAARETGALDTLPFDVVLRLSQVYEHQSAYMLLGSEIGTDVYVDLRRRGVDPVLRDGFGGFVILTSDFGNRERNLVRIYDDALAKLASLPH